MHVFRNLYFGTIYIYFRSIFIFQKQIGTVCEEEVLGI